MLAALRIVLQGDVYIPPKLLSKLQESEQSLVAAGDKNLPRNLLLTARQMEVLDLMAQGLPNKLIAKSLNMAEGTVKQLVAAILRVLGALNRTQAVAEATRRGWLSTP